MKGYKNIIFDLGGVILTIDYNRTIKAFRLLGFKAPSVLYSKASQVNLFDECENRTLKFFNMF